MTRITQFTLFSQAWQNFRDFLNDNLTDPVTGIKSSTRKWVYNKEPKPGNNFHGLPFIQVSDLTITDSIKSFGLGKQIHLLKAIVTIKTKDKENTGDSPQLDAISDELNYAVKTQTSLAGNGIQDVMIDDCGVDDTEYAGAAARIRTFGVTASVVLHYG